MVPSRNIEGISAGRSIGFLSVASNLMCFRMKCWQQWRSYIHYWASIKVVPVGEMILKFFFREKTAPGEYSIYHPHGSNKHMR